MAEDKPSFESLIDAIIPARTHSGIGKTIIIVQTIDITHPIDCLKQQ